jgi:SAM-dependent methyltransferase
MNDDWAPLVSHYERCLLRHGATPQGVDWPSERDLATRFGTLLSGLDDRGDAGRVVMLDVGCGPGFLLDYLRATGRADRVEYRGVDISPRMVESARARWPGADITCRDIVADPLPPQSVDYVVMNGVLTEKQSLAHDAMVRLAESLIAAAFKTARTGVAFNAMNRHVDWQRDELFYWGFDDVSAFLRERVSRHYAFRADYGLYEFTAFVWREPRLPPRVTDGWWTA